MKVELSLSVMAKLFNQGLLTPSEVNCLDEQSKKDADSSNNRNF
ncbi:hypothetical protein [Thiomicrorhabdus hydrogeniphila]